MKKKEVWTKENCIKKARRFRTRIEFKRAYPGGYTRARVQGWLDEVCSHMNRIQKPKGYWTRDQCLTEAKKYKTIKEFQDNSGTAYNKVREFGLEKDAFAHMVRGSHEKGYWTKKRVVDAIKGASCRSEFNKKNAGAVSYLDSYDLRSFFNKVLPSKKTKVFFGGDSWNEVPHDEILKIVQKYKTLKEFRNNESSLYNYLARKKKLEILRRALTHVKYAGFWTKDRCAKEALKYPTRVSFWKSSSGAYNAAKNHGWLDDICTHMKKVGNKFQRALYAFEFSDKSVYVGLTYSYDRRYRDHMKSNKLLIHKTDRMGHTFVMYNEWMTKEDAAKAEGILIEKYRENGWILLNKAKAGGLGGTDKNNLTKKEILSRAKKFETRFEFRQKDNLAYTRARRNGWLEEACRHMVGKYDRIKKAKKKDIFLVSEKYKTLTECTKSEDGWLVVAAKKKGWYEELSKKFRKKHRVKYTQKELFEFAKSCKSRSDLYSSKYAKHYDWDSAAFREALRLISLRKK